MADEEKKVTADALAQAMDLGMDVGVAAMAALMTKLGLLPSTAADSAMAMAKDIAVPMLVKHLEEGLTDEEEVTNA